MPAQEVLAIAKKHFDDKYAEGVNNDTIFGVWYGMNHQPWCAMFVSKCFADAGHADLVAASTKKGFASCDAGLKWFAKKGQVVPVGKAQAGDIAFFQFADDAQADHVGIVKGNDGKGVLYVYEGNTSGDAKGSQSNGDGVFLKKRPYSLIMGVARPAWK